MSNETPPAKRKRTEDPAAEDAETTKRSARFWFDDGNVVLQAGNTQFRVHRSHLVLHSEIMKDCFSCPQPDGVPAVEGCPLVHLPDSVQDIENLCALLYGLYHIDVQGIDTSYLGTMIRMGRKYDISFFKISALKCLRDLFPRTLEEWDVSHLEVKKIILRSPPFLFEVVNMAYENHIPSILPAAFLSMYKLYNLGTLTSGLKLKSNLPGEPDQRIMLEPLALIDCLNGRTSMGSLTQWMLDDIGLGTWNLDGDAIYAVPCYDCTDKPMCSKGLTELFAALVRLGVNSRQIQIPKTFLEICDTYRLLEEEGNPFCDPCMLVLQEIFDKNRIAMWDEFPANLPSWRDTKDFDT
ncbi:hypothetical protein HYPSUDRAFT_164179 [Hypholoma sublateritium FD-334 SS-4]|uniref:BTB domain-containing protein n=1 Tax=Hypholoma sublateritium (strain FD-334 SS-4) TaxID=945553 RepID=A0A0D2PS21_HYPSF|nr:hypothetical protein HYPSUDRAFT_164179 [Hypholoma sublateritium FD-334 SS-4]